MKSTEFCYWLQGLFELAEPTQLNAEQTDLIKRHLAMVFLHEIDKTYPESEQTALSDLHSGAGKIGGKDPVTGHVMRC
jgi:hypothetical protein